MPGAYSVLIFDVEVLGGFLGARSVPGCATKNLLLRAADLHYDEDAEQRR
jgi:hypothetical protein